MPALWWEGIRRVSKRCMLIMSVRRRTDIAQIRGGYPLRTLWAEKTIGFNALQNTVEDFDSEESSHPYQWRNRSPKEVAGKNEAEAKNVLRRMTHVNDITPRDFVEVCIDMKQQGVAGYDSWGAKVQPGYTIPANRDYVWGFTLIPIKNVGDVNKSLRYTY